MKNKATILFGRMRKNIWGSLESYHDRQVERYENDLDDAKVMLKVR